MPEEASSRRVDIATWVGTVLWIIMIESQRNVAPSRVSLWALNDPPGQFLKTGNALP
jgi:hypothetical protein